MISSVIYKGVKLQHDDMYFEQKTVLSDHRILKSGTTKPNI